MHVLMVVKNRVKLIIFKLQCPLPWQPRCIATICFVIFVHFVQCYQSMKYKENRRLCVPKKFKWLQRMAIKRRPIDLPFFGGGAREAKSNVGITLPVVCLSVRPSVTLCFFKFWRHKRSAEH